MRVINLTPHIIRMNDGREFPPSGIVARVDSTYGVPDGRGVCKVVFGGLRGLPDAADGTLYVASAMVCAALGTLRPDVVAPATGHPEAVRKDGQVYSVPCFVR